MGVALVQPKIKMVSTLWFTAVRNAPTAEVILYNTFVINQKWLRASGVKLNIDVKMRNWISLKQI